MYYGADYYPEHWPEDRWPTDARLMREAHFNVARLAEFAWALMEPEEGKFNFGWLHKAIDLLAAEGIQTVLGTPTAAAPAWLCQQHPEMMRLDDTGHRAVFGLRQHTCINNPDFRKASDRIVTAMAKEFGKRDDVIAWQTDNEFGRLCYCPICRTKFQEWLKELYGDLDSLNAAWGTVFWSHIYSDWSQIPVPMIALSPSNPSLALDYRRFMSSSFDTFQASQIKILRELSPGRPITHNFMGFLPEILDYQQLARDLDFASWDNYPMFRNDPYPGRMGLNHDQTRGLKQSNFWVMEQQSGPTGWDTMSATPRPGQIRLFTYQAIAHGADGIVYFRWRPCRFGTEQYWHGILNHDGSVNRRYKEVAQIGAEVKAIWPELEGSEPVAEVAILNDYDSRFAFQFQKSNPAFDYAEHVRRYYDPLHEMSVTVDVICCDVDLSKYKIVIAPTLFVLKEETAKRLREYVQNGGCLITTFRTGVKDEYSRIVDEALPGRIRDVMGVRVEEYHSPWTDEVNKIAGVDGDLPEGEVKLWVDVLEPQGAEVIANYSEGFAPGKPAITRNSFGKGAAIYVGTAPSKEFNAAFLKKLLAERGVKQGPDRPDWVEISTRRKGDTNYLFAMNHSAEVKEVPSLRSGIDLLTGKALNQPLTLEPFGVAIVKQE
jgi:beta-galactosidase